MTPAAAEDRERVGPYRVIRAIGAGGSARIDLARIDRAYGFQRHVVIKRPLEHLRANPQVAASLRREARIGGLLRHPNLVGVLDAGVHDGYDYLALEYVHGAALRTVMQTEAPRQVRQLPLAVALAIVCDVARGIHEAHQLTDDRGSPLGLVHRDVSPGNILIGFDGSVKLADFGIAKETRVSTLSGSIHGTVTYMAPEQCQGHAFDRRADVFSLGVILYELVTGTRLFWADNDVASLHRVLSGSVPRPRRIKPQLASALEDIIMTAVAHDASKRYPTALELATALELHAAAAGDVLGARWIARTMEAVVGPQQAPWIATTAAREPAPRGDGSLIELIAAAGSDEPLEPSFGDVGSDAGGDAIADAIGDAIDPADAVARDLAAAGRPAVAPARPARTRRFVGGLLAIAVIGSATVAVILTRGSDAPAATDAALAAPGPTLEPPAPPQAPRPEPAPSREIQPSPVEPPHEAQPAPGEPPREAQPDTAGGPATSSETSTPAPAKPARITPGSPGTGTVAKKRRRGSQPGKLAPSTAATTPSALPSSALPSSAAPSSAPPSSAPPSSAAPSSAAPSSAPPSSAPPSSTPPSSNPAAAATAGASEPRPPAPERPSDTSAPPAAGSAAPPARPPPNVQWKPTLLLPTDGSAARPPK